jgi:hypothetical protein
MPDVGRLVMPVETVPNQQWTRETVAPADYFDWRREMEQGGAIETLAAFRWWDAEPGRPRRTRTPPGIFRLA